jgi:hypothetical protein
MNIKSRLRHLFHKPAAVVRNDAGERIESLRFTVPALRVGVLEYAPGQLTTGNKKLDGKTVKLYYPPESVSDEKFLKSLETAPVVVGSHETTTNENNKKIDGWAHTVSFDTGQKAAMIAGVVKGNKEVAYIKGNLKMKDFGASAFVDIYDMEIKNGITPDGQEYNAIAKDLRATHVALAPHVRDPENKIKVTNAVVFNAAGNYKSEEKGEKMEMTPEQIAAIVKNAVSEVLAAKNTEDKVKELEEEVKNLKAKNEAYEGKETEKEEAEEKKKEAENSDEEKKDEKEDKEDATLENAKPTQELVKAVGTAMNIDFGSKTPSFKSLAGMLGIKEDDPALRIAAVNAKYAEIVNKKPATAQNAGTVEVF